MNHVLSLIALALLLFAAGCTASDAGTGTQDESLGATGARCTVRGDPPVTRGCEEGEVCIPEVCTASIPPSCAGHCGPGRPRDAGVRYRATGSEDGARCSISGPDGEVTGCSEGERCAPVACTDSIPPSCWGTCEPGR
jgi:hypothetical protein